MGPVDSGALCWRAPEHDIFERLTHMYISMTPVAVAGSTVLGVTLISSSAPRASAAPHADVVASVMHSPIAGLAGVLLIVVALVLVGLAAKRPRS